MKEEYRPKTTLQKLGKLVEEAGEVQAAIGKALRWGLGGSNPELPEDERETNCDWILREIGDLEEACAIVRSDLELRYHPDYKASLRELVEDFKEDGTNINRDLSDALNLSPKEVDDLLDGVTSLTIEHTVGLAAVLGMTPGFWWRVMHEEF
jgi:hypothetical protein